MSKFTISIITITFLFLCINMDGFAFKTNRYIYENTDERYIANQLTNLTPMSIIEDSTNNITISNNYYHMDSSTNILGTIINLSEVKKISCSQQYNLIAEIFQQKTDGTIFRKDLVFDKKSPYGIDGVNNIDFSRYKFNGYAVVAIRNNKRLSVDNKAPNYISMGFLSGYRDVFADIHVEYKDNINVRFDNIKNDNVRNNIRIIEKLTVPHMNSGYYKSVLSKSVYRYPEMWNVTPGWYVGNYHANAPLLHLSMKSYFTSAKNPNSRLYKPARENRDGVYGGAWYGYGWNCGSFVSTILGLDLDISTTEFFFGKTACRYFDSYELDLNNIDFIHPGDVLVYYNFEKGYSHIMMCYNKVYVNNKLKCINIIEAYPPFARRRPLMVNSTLLNVKKNTPLGYYNVNMMNNGCKWKVFRIKPQFCKSIEKKYDLKRKFKVGSVMCDRGSDSVYCLDTPHIYLSISDADINSIKLFRNGLFYNEIVISDLTCHNENNMRVIDIANKVKESGYYTILTNKHNSIQESFFVPENQSVVYNGIDLIVSNPNDVKNVIVFGRRKNAGVATFSYRKEDIKNGFLKIDKHSDLNFQIYSIYVFYKTPYGDYWVNSNGKQSTDYIGIGNESEI